MRHCLTLIFFLLPSIALAQAAASTPPSESPPFWVSAAPWIAMAFIFYFLIVRPQARKQKEQQEVNSGLKRGDEVLTSGGIFGTIEGLTDKFVTLEIADGVSIRILRSQIMGSVKDAKEVKT
jgi:preprotein translocase subunit YajC